MVLPYIQPTFTMHRSARPTVWMPAAAMVIFMAIYLPVASALVHITAPQTSVAAAPITRSTPPVSTTPTAPATASAAVAPTASPNCRPLAFGMPGQLSLDGQPAGLHVATDTPALYQIYGNTASELRSQIQRCAPGAHGGSSAEFTAETSYSITWQYSTVVSSSSCSVTNVKIGLHTAMALPLWQPTANATGGLAGRWQSFMASLETHEQGHVAINRLYAAQLLSDLNGLPPVSCDNLTSTVNNLIQTDVGALNAANDNYDASTDHGATQGAILPSY